MSGRRDNDAHAPDSTRMTPHGAERDGDDLPQSNPRAATWSAHDTQSETALSSAGMETARVRFSEDTGTRTSDRNETSTSHSEQIEEPRRQPGNAASTRSASRNRGYSLRRSLFTQNIQKQNEDGGDAVEMEPTSSSSRSTSSDSKSEKGPTVITIEEAGESKPRTAAGAYGTGINSTAGPTKADPAWMQKRKGQPPGLKHLLAQLAALRKRIIGPVDIPSTVDGRHVQINIHQAHDPLDERTKKPYISNKIRSCKYTLWNFFPKQLVAQFSKLANFYFLVVAILQMIPGLSTTGTYTTIVPLLIFVFISMAKEGYEDIRRNRLDKEENESTTFVLNEKALRTSSTSKDDTHNFRHDSGAWTQKKWQELKVGDVLLLERDSAIPADVVLLRSAGAEGIVHIETKSLDGETNLKSKKPLDVVSQHCKTEADIARLEADFVVEDPNLDLYRFDGRLSIGGQTLPLTLSEVVYRGSIVRNTPCTIGLVVYSGEECKIRMNSNKDPRVKAPTLQAKVNRVVIIVACLVFFVAIIESIGYIFWKRTTENDSWYLDAADVPFGQILTSFIIMFNTMLPLSLYVSLEIVKVVQMFMMNDIDMYDPVTDTPIARNTSTLNEELGQVSYIFSDKTGTLTNNEMKFRKMSVAGTAWLHDHDLLQEADAAGPALRHKKRTPKGKEKQQMHKLEQEQSMSPFVKDDPAELARKCAERVTLGKQFAHTGRTDDLIEYLRRRPQSLFARKARLFLLALALCHTAIPEKTELGEIDYQVSSPDELALVTAAQDLGFILTDRQSRTMTVKTIANGDSDSAVFETYQILDVIEFSSARKRMSILVRLPDGRVCLFSKGADTTIKSLLRQRGLADLYTDDIRRKSEARKSMDVHSARTRRSSQFGHMPLPGSVGAPVIGRQSSISAGRGHSVRDSIDSWLRAQEAGAKTPRRSNAHYSPRPSENVAAPTAGTFRGSTDSRSGSFQTDDLNDMVDESIVVNENAIFERCFNHIDDFATEGLRTLLYGHRYIAEDEYNKWREIYHAAATSLNDRQNKIEKAAEIIEQQLELTGATAIEDKLQAGVPDAIERFRRAGIKMWMLTGDKRETAINIGHSCRLIKDYSHVMILDHESGDLHRQLVEYLDEISSDRHAHCVLVVDGQTLTVVDAEPTLNALFTDLAIAIDSVVCCRASPSQKAGLVKTIRTKVKGSVTLAIGDGANDIAMIQEAHLGIGIAGKEGLQAARTSDYSIAQFRFLVKLLLVHGRWNYVRVCKYTLGTFWKEMLFYLVQATYQRWNGYTGTSLYEPWSLSMFNTLFTSLPVIFMGAFEKDLAPATLIAVPELYNLGQKNRGFNIPLYAIWAFIGALESQIVYFIMWAVYGQAVFTRDKHLFAMGALAFTACVTLISLKLQFFELHNKSITAAIAMFLSVGGWWLWNIILSKLYDSDERIYYVNGGLLNSFGRNMLWWLTIILIVLAVSIFEILLKTIKTIYFPNDVEVYQVYERDLQIKKRFEESAADLLQTGWDRGTKKSSGEIQRNEEEQRRREAEVQELLERPRTMATVTSSEAQPPPVVGIRKRPSWTPDQAQEYDLDIMTTQQQLQVPLQRTNGNSLDVGDLFKKGYGMVRKDSMK